MTVFSEVFGTSPSDGQNYSAEEIRVLDGDTVEISGTGERIRVEGMDSPETAKHWKGEAAQRGGDAATEDLRRFAEHGVTITRAGEKGVFGRTLATISNANNDMDYAAQSIRNGRSFTSAYSPAKYIYEQHMANVDAYESGGPSEEGRAAGQAAYDQAMHERGPNLRNPDGVFANSIARGAKQTKAMAYGFANAVSELVGADAVAEWSEDGIANALAEADLSPPRIHSWDDVDNLAEFGTFVIEKIGEQVPQLAMDAAMFIGGGGIGGIAAKQIAKRAAYGKSMKRMLGEKPFQEYIKQKSKQGFATGGRSVHELLGENVLDPYIKHQAKKGFAQGGKAAAAAGIYSQVAGETQIELRDAGVDSPETALLAGVPKAALEYAGLKHLIGSVADAYKVPAKSVGDLAAKIATKFGMNSIVEGGTELAQTIIDKAAVSLHTGEDVFSEENMKEMRTAFASGAVVGGAFSTVGGAVDGVKYATQDKPTKESGKTEGATEPAETAETAETAEVKAETEAKLETPKPLSQEEQIEKAIDALHSTRDEEAKLDKKLRYAKEDKVAALDPERRELVKQKDAARKAHLEAGYALYDLGIGVPETETAAGLRRQGVTFEEATQRTPNKQESKEIEALEAQIAPLLDSALKAAKKLNARAKQILNIGAPTMIGEEGQTRYKFPNGAELTPEDADEWRALRGEIGELRRRANEGKKYKSKDNREQWALLQIKLDEAYTWRKEAFKRGKVFADDQATQEGLSKSSTVEERAEESDFLDQYDGSVDDNLSELAAMNFEDPDLVNDPLHKEKGYENLTADERSRRMGDHRAPAAIIAEAINKHFSGSRESRRPEALTKQIKALFEAVIPDIRITLKDMMSHKVLGNLKQVTAEGLDTLTTNSKQVNRLTAEDYNEKVALWEAMPEVIDDGFIAFRQAEKLKTLMNKAKRGTPQHKQAVARYMKAKAKYTTVEHSKAGMLHLHNGRLSSLGMKLLQGSLPKGDYGSHQRTGYAHVMAELMRSGFDVTRKGREVDHINEGKKNVAANPDKVEPSYKGAHKNPDNEEYENLEYDERLADQGGDTEVGYTAFGEVFNPQMTKYLDQQDEDRIDNLAEAEAELKELTLEMLKADTAWRKAQRSPESTEEKLQAAETELNNLKDKVNKLQGLISNYDDQGPTLYDPTEARMYDNYAPEMNSEDAFITYPDKAGNALYLDADAEVVTPFPMRTALEAQLREIEAVILGMINAQRTKQGVEPLTAFNSGSHVQIKEAWEALGVEVALPAKLADSFSIKAIKARLKAARELQAAAHTYGDAYAAEAEAEGVSRAGAFLKSLIIAKETKTEISRLTKQGEEPLIADSPAFTEREGLERKAHLSRVLADTQAERKKHPKQAEKLRKKEAKLKEREEVTTARLEAYEGSEEAQSDTKIVETLRREQAKVRRTLEEAKAVMEYPDSTQEDKDKQAANLAKAEERMKRIVKNIELRENKKQHLVGHLKGVKEKLRAVQKALEGYKSPEDRKALSEKENKLQAAAKVAEQEKKKGKYGKNLGVLDGVVERFQAYLGENGLRLPQIMAVTSAEMERITGGKKAKAFISSTKNGPVIYLDLERHTNERDIMRSLKHEAIAHYGWRHAVSKKDRDTILRMIIEAKNVELRDLWAEVQSPYGAYAKMSEMEQAEEVLALAAETLDLSKTPLMKKLKIFITALMRRMGIANARITRAEVDDLLLAIAKGHVASRTAEQDIVAELAAGFQRAEGVKPIPTRIWERAKHFWKNRDAGFPLIKFFATADRRLRQISPELADMYNEQVQGGKKGKKRGFLQGKANMTNLWVGQWKRVMQKLEGKYSKEEIEAGIKYLRESDDTDTLTNPVAIEVNKYLETFGKNYARNKEFNPTMGWITNYFPRKYDLIEIRERQEEFAAILEKHGYDNPTGTIAKILSNANGYEGQTIEDVVNATAPTANATKGRILDGEGLDLDLSEAGFVFSDPQQVMEQYIQDMVKRVEYQRVFGGWRMVQGSHVDEKGNYNATNLETIRAVRNMAKAAGLDVSGAPSELVKKFIKAGHLRIAGAAGDKYFEWYSPTFKEHEMLDQIEVAQGMPARQEAQKVIDAYQGRLGLDLDPKVRKAMSYAMVLESYLTLAFSAVASLPDFGGALIRTREMNTAWKGFKGAMAQHSKKDRKDMYEIMGLVNQRMTHQQLLEMYGQNHADERSQKLMDKLFKYNGQEWLTDRTRIFAYEVGREFIKKHAQNRTERGDKYLDELHLTAEDVLAWIENGEPLWNADMVGENESLALNSRSVQEALYQFVDESVVRPNAAQRPVFGSNPAYSLVWHLKSFFYSYGKQIIWPMAREAINRAGKGDNVLKVAEPIAIGALTLLPLAAASLELREFIKGEDEEERSRNTMDGLDYTYELMGRAGAFGPFEMILSLAGGYGEPSERMAHGLGPSIDHFTTLISTGEGSVTTEAKLIRSIPGISQNLFGSRDWFQEWYREMGAESGIEI